MNKRQEEILAAAYEYARDVIEGRWPEAEKTIIKDPYWAYKYANYVIKGRWPEAEKTISKHPQMAYEYANYVIKGRWPKAEKTIIKDPYWAYYYTKHVIEGQRSDILESNYLCDANDCKFSTVEIYMSRIDWSDPANDFPIPKRLKRALKKSLMATA